jgi:hypothetical protein
LVEEFGVIISYTHFVVCVSYSQGQEPLQSCKIHPENDSNHPAFLSDYAGIFPESIEIARPPLVSENRFAPFRISCRCLYDYSDSENMVKIVAFLKLHVFEAVRQAAPTRQKQIDHGRCGGILHFGVESAVVFGFKIKEVKEIGGDV